MELVGKRTNQTTRKETNNMTTQHTRGPWNIAPHDHANTIWADNGVICDVFHGNEDDDMTASVENKEEAEANARLIASAPDLLAALQSINEWLEEPIDYREQPEQIAWANGIARAAIAKATQQA